jgi:hypothetical protein
MYLAKEFCVLAQLQGLLLAEAESILHPTLPLKRCPRSFFGR